jgi:hypothetical protein
LKDEIMNLTQKEEKFLTALAREQNQTGCRGPAHDILRKFVYPDAPLTGRGSLSFSYDAVPLTNILFKGWISLQEINDFLRQEEMIPDPEWPWSSAEDFRNRLEEAKKTLGHEVSAV